MSWNSDKSLKLSRLCVYIFTLIMIIVALFAPKIFKVLIEARIGYLGGTLPYFLISTYTACIPAACALGCLNKLLGNIEQDKVFVAENVSILRLLSWCCIFAAVICLISCLYYLPFLILSVAAAFVGLILRVVKNVFSQAVELKNDNDFTI